YLLLSRVTPTLLPATPTPIPFSFHSHGDHRHLHSFPTRRSSDLLRAPSLKTSDRWSLTAAETIGTTFESVITSFMAYLSQTFFEDRKSTRLNSSHVKISYAVFCLKKKKKKRKSTEHRQSQ